ncbi:unnamed protein product, partial [Allacma fusca]
LVKYPNFGAANLSRKIP